MLKVGTLVDWRKCSLDIKGGLLSMTSEKPAQ